MLINNSVNSHVKFISYTGDYPNLCSGILTLEIYGIEYTFGHSYSKSIPEPDFPRFWCSGGNVSFDDDWNEHVEYGEWKINVNDLPEQFREYAQEIDRVFNKNVESGCCGGCI